MMNTARRLVSIIFITVLFMGSFCHGQNLSTKHLNSLQGRFTDATSFSPAARPFIQTFRTSAQLTAEFRAIIQDNRGIMYFGNTNFGVHQFDGENWNEILPNNRSTIFGLARNDEGTIFAGARGDFGYLTPDSQNRLQFQSLLPDAPDSLQSFDRVYVEIIENAVFFCTNPYLFRWENDEITIWENSNFAGCGVAGNTLYVNDQQEGLQILAEGTFKSFSPITKNRFINSVIQLNNGSLFVTSQALFVKTGL